jgi:hypothetical protein
MADKLFTLDEALALLPVIRQLIADIQAERARVDALTSELDELETRTGGNGHLTSDVAETRRRLQEAVAALERLIGELQETGAELKGIDQGLVDFPSEREGRVVYLCWQLGEDTIAWWHELDTGFAGRQPL